MKRACSVSGLAIAILVGAAPQMYAHHAINAEYDLNSPAIVKKGVLTKVENLYPHPKWYFDVTQADGKFEHWIVMTAAPIVLVRMGLKVKSDLKPGDTYTFRLMKARDGSTLGLLTAVVLPDGREFTMRYAPGERAEAPLTVGK